MQGSSSAEKGPALPGGLGADPYISELDLMPGGGSSRWEIAQFAQVSGLMSGYELHQQCQQWSQQAGGDDSVWYTLQLVPRPRVSLALVFSSTACNCRCTTKT